jgi:hypothetical protein
MRHFAVGLAVAAGVMMAASTPAQAADSGWKTTVTVYPSTRQIADVRDLFWGYGPSPSAIVCPQEPAVSQVAVTRTGSAKPLVRAGFTAVPSSRERAEPNPNYDATSPFSGSNEKYRQQCVFVAKFKLPRAISYSLFFLVGDYATKAMPVMQDDFASGAFRIKRTFEQLAANVPEKQS